MNHAAPPSKRRWLKRLGIGAVIVGILLACAGLYAYNRSNAQPESWQQERERIARMGTTEKLDMAEGLRNWLLSEWSSTEPSEEFAQGNPDSLLGQRRRFAIPYDELNVWLDVEGRSLLEAVGIGLPERVRHVIVSGTPGGKLVLSFEDQPDGKGRVYALTFDIGVAQDGTVTSTLTGATAGRLPLPVDAAARLIRSTSPAAPANSPNLLDALLTGQPVQPQDLPIDPGEDGVRDGRIVGLEVQTDAIIVTRETVARPRP